MTNRSELALVLFLAVIFSPGVAPGAERCAVSAPIANIRSGPGTNFDVIWQVEQYYPFIVLEKKGDWYKVQDFEGDKGWLHRSLLDKTETIVVKTKNGNIRSGPGTDFPIAFRVNSGVPFKILQTKGEWINIRHVDGDNGWINRSLTW